MGLIASIKGKILKTAVNKVAASEPKTSILGALLGGIVAANIDYNKLLQGDPQQIGNAVGAAVVVLLGWFANNAHKKAVPPTEPPPDNTAG